MGGPREVLVAMSDGAAQKFSSPARPENGLNGYPYLRTIFPKTIQILRQFGMGPFYGAQLLKSVSVFVCIRMPNQFLLRPGRQKHSPRAGSLKKVRPRFFWTAKLLERCGKSAKSDSHTGLGTWFFADTAAPCTHVAKIHLENSDNNRGEHSSQVKAKKDQAGRATGPPDSPPRPAPGGFRSCQFRADNRRPRNRKPGS